MAYFFFLDNSLKSACSTLRDSVETQLFWEKSIWNFDRTIGYHHGTTDTTGVKEQFCIIKFV